MDKLSSLGVQLSLIEMLLGSLVHAFQIPFGGHLLSLNQGFFLIRSLSISNDNTSSVRFPIYLSTVASLLKSLSPAGNKLAPMLSISAQGFLFSFGIFIFGPGLLGQIVGMAFLSLWAFVQPILTLFLFFGKNLIPAFFFYLQKLQHSLHLSQHVFVLIFISCILLKLFLACAIPIVLRMKKEESLTIWMEQISDKARPQIQKLNIKSEATHKEAIKNAFRDLFRPYFIVSFVLMVIFFYFSESSFAEVIWKCLRPLGIAILFFYLCRSPWLRFFLLKIKRNGHFPQLFDLFERTHKKLFSKETL
jgi:hypothetical protein